MGTNTAFATVGEAMDMARAALSYLAAVDATQLAAETQAECLRTLERTDAISTAVRASFLSACTAGKGYSADADYSARTWLMHPNRDHPGCRGQSYRVGEAGQYPSPDRCRAGQGGDLRVLCPCHLPVDRPAAGEVPGGVR